MMNMGFGMPFESHGYAGQGLPPASAVKHPVQESSGQSQFSAAPPQPLPHHQQMNAGQPAYGYSSQPPRPMQSGGSALPVSGAAPQLAAPMSQPQPRKLDPDQMPSPVSRRHVCHNHIAHKAILLFILFNTKFVHEVRI